MTDIENIIIEDEYIVIITSTGCKHTIEIDNKNPSHKAFVENIISMAISLVDETDEDISDGEFTNSDTPDFWGDYSDEEEEDWG